MSARLSLATAVAALLFACPAAPPPDPLPEAPRVVRFTASPTSVARGQPVTLTWETSNATAVEVVDLNRGAIAGVADVLSGQVQVPVAQPTVFVVSARNERGVRASAVASVNVEGVDSAGIVFTSYPGVLQPGQSALLVWSAPGASSVEISQMGGQPLNLRGQRESGSISVEPVDTTTTYVLRADGAVRTVQVTRAQGISDFNASKLAVRPGETITLSWKTTNATKVTLTSPGRGVLTEATTPAQIAMGSFQDTLLTQADRSSVVYLLAVEGAVPVTTRQLTVSYGVAPAITTLTAPKYAKETTTFPVTWATTGADRVEVIANGAVLYRTPTLELAQGATVRIPAPSPGLATRHQLRAISSNSGATAVRDFDVFGVTDVGTPTLTANPTSVAAGAPVTLTFNAPGSARTRIVENGEVTVAAIEGTGAAAGTVTVYPNRGTTTYELVASNTLEPVVRVSTSVTVSQTIGIDADDGGVVFQTQGRALVRWAAPSSAGLVGFALTDTVTGVDAGAFVDIAQTGTPLTFTSDLATVQVPNFETFIHGRRVEAPLWVSTHGFLQFSSLPVTNARPAPVALPSEMLPETFVAPLWTTLSLGAGRVLWEVRGAAPEQELIVQWNEVQSRASGDQLTFQARISQLGTITFAYRSPVRATVLPEPVIGLQGPRGQGLVTPITTVPQDTFVTHSSVVGSPALVSTQSGVGGFLRQPNGVMRVLFDTIVRPSDLFISEVMSRPSPAVMAGQWFELTNRSGARIDLSGWTVSLGADGGALVMPQGSVLLPRSAIVIGASSNPTENDGLPAGTVQVSNLAVGTQGLRVDNGQGFQNEFSTTKVAAVGESLNVDPGPFVYLTLPDGGVATPSGSEVCSARPTQTYGSQAPLQRGTPGVDVGGACIGYSVSSITPRFKDISATGTPVTLIPTSFFPANDDGVAELDLTAAPITLFGNSVSALTVSSNGWLLPRGGYTGGAAPLAKNAPSSQDPKNGVVAPFWDDLELPASRMNSRIFVQRFAMGADPTEPRPHWIVQWNHIDFFLPRADLTFQVKLFAAGDVEFHYANMTGVGAAGETATIWLEAPDNARALFWSIDTPSVVTNSAIRFTRAQ